MYLFTKYVKWILKKLFQTVSQVNKNLPKKLSSKYVHSFIFRNFLKRKTLFNTSVYFKKLIISQNMLQLDLSAFRFSWNVWELWILPE